MAIKINAAGSRHARTLIAAGDVDKDAAWSFTAADGDALLGPDGNDWEAYSAVHLAIDDAAADKTKARYKYPVAKGAKVYRSGVIAAKDRAAQQDRTAIEDEAGALLELIDGKKDAIRGPNPSGGRRAMGAGYSMAAQGGAAEIYIYEDVGAGWFGGVSAKQFAEDLAALGPIDQIDLRLNSYGGEVFDGLAIYRQLVDHPARVVSHVDGIAASIASVIAMAGDEIEIAEAGFMMIHPAQGFCMGPADDMRAMATTLDQITGSIADVYAARTKAPLADIRGWMNAETWLTAADCIDRGFADKVAENMRLAAHVDFSKHKFANLPAALRPRGSIGSKPTPAAPPGLASARERLARMKAKLTLAA